MNYRNMKRVLRSLLLLTLMLCVARTGWCASGPLVDLNAAGLSEGPLAAWENAGRLKGTFKSDGTRPEVKTIDGAKAVVFDGREHMLSDFTAPDTITGDQPFSCVVRTLCYDVRGERALIAWSSRPVNCMEIEYADPPEWGAFGTYSDAQLGWVKGVPETGRWHYLAYTYTGGKEGTLQAWCDGELRASKKGTIATKPGRKFVLGACQAEDGPDKFRYEHAIHGAIASVQVYDRALTTAEVWKASGMETAYPAFPERGSQLESLEVTLKWIPAKPSVASYDVYLGTDQAAVQSATTTNGELFKGSRKAEKSEFGPVSLELGKTYYWRIDQRDASGKTDHGTVAAFSTDSGLATRAKPDDGGFFVEGGKKNELSWTPGKFAVKQNVYFGNSAAEVLSATKPVAADLPVTATSIPMPVANPPAGKTYYWRVESINRDGVPAAKGDVWSVRIVSTLSLSRIAPPLLR